MNTTDNANGAPRGRDVELQHTMLQLAIERVSDEAHHVDPVTRKPDARAVAAAMHNQTTQALTAIALELRELRLRPPRLTIAGDVNAYPGPTL